MARYCWLFYFLGIVAGYSNPDPQVRFIANHDQWRKPVQFSARIGGGTMALLPGKFQFIFIDQVHHHGESLYLAPELNDDDGTRGVLIQVDFIGSNLLSQPQPFGVFPEYYNYYLGNDPSLWRSDVKAYQGARYPSLYPGIDLKVYSEGTRVKYDFILKPYANPDNIHIAYSGMNSVGIEHGDLVVKSAVVSITEKKPIAFQYIEGKKVLVRCEFVLSENNVSFHFPDGYDPCHELTIDPLLIFSTYSGSEADNWGSSATPAEHGNMYSAGATFESVFTGKYPATPGAFQTASGGDYDIGILKYDSLGRRLLYASYLGGEFAESAHSLVMDSNEDLIVFGTTSSSDFPIRGDAFQKTYAGGIGDVQVYFYDEGSDIFVARISGDGKQLKACTYLGGSGNDGMSENFTALCKNYGDGLRGDVITDAEHNVYFSSVTSSADFPSIGSGTNYQGGATDALLVKLNPDLSDVIFSRFIGGNDVDAAHTLKLDSEGNVIIGGGTFSNNFPVTSGAAQVLSGGDVDGWIARIDPSGSAILQATYTGMSGYDQVFFLDLDPEENVYVFGQTTSSDFIKTPEDVFHQVNGGQFIQKFNKDLDAILISTVFGSGRGEPDISPTAFLVNECQNIFLAGWGGELNNLDFGQPGTGHWVDSSTEGLTVTTDALQPKTTGNDFYLLVLNAGLTEMVYATFFGGDSSATHVDGGTSRFDRDGIVYQAVCSSCRGIDDDFITTEGAVSSTNNSPNCNNLAFKLDLSSLTAVLQTNSLEMDMPGITDICFPDTLIFENFSIGGESFLWDMGDGKKFSTRNRTPFRHFYKTGGTYTVWLRAIDMGTCKVRDSVSVKINVGEVEGETSDDATICDETSITLQASGGDLYHWTSSDGSFESTAPSITVSPNLRTEYFVDISDSNVGCMAHDTVVIEVIPLIVPDFSHQNSGECVPVPGITVTNLTPLSPGDTFLFDFGDGFTSDEPVVEHVYEEDGFYTIKLITMRDFCVTEKSETVPVFRLRAPNVITPKEKDGANDAFRVFFGADGTHAPSDFGFAVSVVIYNRWGRKVYESDNYQNNWAGDGVESGIYFFELKVDTYTSCKSWLEVIK